MSDLNNKHLPSDVDKLTRKDLVELFHIQMAENQELLKRITELKEEKRRLILTRNQKGEELGKLRKSIAELERDRDKRDIEQQIKSIKDACDYANNKCVNGGGYFGDDYESGFKQYGAFAFKGACLLYAKKLQEQLKKEVSDE